MASDEVVTYDDVARWLPSDVRRELDDALGPQLRGWYTEAEMEACRDGRFVEVTTFENAASRFLRTDLPRG